MDNQVSILDRLNERDALLNESFSSKSNEITHRITLGKEEIESKIEFYGTTSTDLKGAWWKAYLDGIPVEPSVEREQTLSVLDLFCGIGGLALGLKKLCSEAGLKVISEAIVDQDREASRVYAANHPTRFRIIKSVSSIVDYTIRGEGSTSEYLYPPEVIDEKIGGLEGDIDVILAGPPCKGHSNLNNESRRDDRRNILYLTVPAIAVALGAPVVVIENVPAVVHDYSKVVQTTEHLLANAGYEVSSGVLSAPDMGWPQNRQRHFLVARKNDSPLPLEAVSRQLSDDIERSIWWAIGDLEGRTSESPMDRKTELSEKNQKRIDWLFANNEHDLPLQLRPKSHQDGTTYTSVYGRLYKDKPAPTVTTGFLSPGRGRYIHPTEKRVITPREAARVQGFPDTYDFVVDPDREPHRKELAKWIGGAVPMPLGYAASLAALAPDL